jgi:hypothetical protein
MSADNISHYFEPVSTVLEPQNALERYYRFRLQYTQGDKQAEFADAPPQIIIGAEHPVQITYGIQIDISAGATVFVRYSTKGVSSNFYVDNNWQYSPFSINWGDGTIQEYYPHYQMARNETRWREISAVAHRNKPFAGIWHRYMKTGLFQPRMLIYGINYANPQAHFLDSHTLEDHPYVVVHPRSE